MEKEHPKSVAVMQPYIFPYIGYFQLIYAVDEFVFYDDVNFVKQGWINRNQILDTNGTNMFTIPLKKISSFKLINEVEINTALYNKWFKKFTKSIEQIYLKAPYYKDVFPVIFNTLSNRKTDLISDLAIDSIKNIADYLDLDVNFHTSSDTFSETQNSDRTVRLIKICQILNANRYINAQGGKELYEQNDFKKQNIDLLFLNAQTKSYQQFVEKFESNLSIIDVLMFNSKEDTLKLLNNYKLQ